MDPLANAGLLAAVVFGATELAKAALPTGWFYGSNAGTNSRATALLAVVVGQAATFLVGASVWAHEQVIYGHPLDKVNVATKVLVGLLVAAGAAVGERFLNAVRNIGQNQPKAPIAK